MAAASDTQASILMDSFEKQKQKSLGYQPENVRRP